MDKVLSRARQWIAWRSDIMYLLWFYEKMCGRPMSFHQSELAKHPLVGLGGTDWEVYKQIFVEEEYALLADLTSA